jgi:hypothetical protein
MRPVGLGALVNFSRWLDRQDQSLTQALKMHRVWKDAKVAALVSPLPEASVIQQKSAKPTSATKICRVLFLEALLLLIKWETKQAPLCLYMQDAAGTNVPWDWALFQPPAKDMASAACLLSYLTETDAAGPGSSWANVMRKLVSCKRGQEENVQGRQLVLGGCDVHVSFTVTDRHASSGPAEKRSSRVQVAPAAVQVATAAAVAVPLAASIRPAAGAATLAECAPPPKRLRAALPPPPPPQGHERADMPQAFSGSRTASGASLLAARLLGAARRRPVLAACQHTAAALLTPFIVFVLAGTSHFGRPKNEAASLAATLRCSCSPSSNAQIDLMSPGRDEQSGPGEIWRDWRRRLECGDVDLEYYAGCDHEMSAVMSWHTSSLHVQGQGLMLA